MKTFTKILFAVMLLSVIGTACLKTSETSYAPSKVGDGWFLGEAPNAIDYSEGILLPHYVFDYMKFQVGSYWIYKEENSGAIDSVWVVPSVYPDTIYFCHGKKYQYIQTVTQSSFSNTKTNYFSTTWGSYSQYSKENYLIAISMDKVDLQNNLLYKYNNGPKADMHEMDFGCIFTIHSELYRPKMYGYYQDSLITDKYYHTLKLNGINFSDVLQTEDSNNLFEGEKTQTLFARYVGLIAFRKLESKENWQLIRYKVIQNEKITTK